MNVDKLTQPFSKFEVGTVFSLENEPSVQALVKFHTAESIQIWQTLSSDSVPEVVVASTYTPVSSDWIIVAITLVLLLLFLWYTFKFFRWILRGIVTFINRFKKSPRAKAADSIATGAFILESENTGLRISSSQVAEPSASDEYSSYQRATRSRASGSRSKRKTNLVGSTSVLVGDTQSSQHWHREAPLTTVVTKTVPVSGKEKGSSWVRPGKTVTVAKRKIRGMVYVGAAPTDGGYSEPDNAFINPSLSVAKKGGDWGGKDLSYWPNYSHLTPRARATYLDWLAEGKTRLADPGYMFLYFYGLERRYFRDKTKEKERMLIVEEVQRLYNLFYDNRSSARYLGAFLDVASLTDANHIPAPDILPDARKTSDLPVSLKVGIALQIDANAPLSAKWLRAWYFLDADTRFRTPAKRCGEEFAALFDALFERDYPDGMPLRRPKRKLKVIYHAASGKFKADRTDSVGDLADISSLRKPLTIAERIAHEATEALEKYSRLVGKDAEARGTIAAHALLPVEIRHQFPCAEAEAIADWASAVIRQGGLVDAAGLLQKINGSRPDRFTRKQLTDASDTMLGMGVGVAPDPRFALRSPKFGEPVILFDLPENTHSLDVSTLFGAAALRVATATMVAQVDGVVSVEEEAVIDSIVNETPNLSPAERLRLSATARWMRAVPPDMAMMRKRIKSAPDAARNAVAELAVQMAAADGSASTDEIGQLEKLYKTLGLDTRQLYSNLHSAVAAPADEPVTVRPAERGAEGLQVPAEKPSLRTTTIGLDQAKIAKISEDTKNVSVLLGSIFGTDEPEADEQDEAVFDETDSLPGLTPKLTVFLRELAEREHWSELEFEKIVRDHGLMAAGSLEAINEWSFTTYGRVFLDEYEGYDVDPEIATELRD